MRRAILATWRRRASVGRFLPSLVFALAAGCLPGTMLDQAIRARGGPLGGLVRESDAQVSLAFPGPWQWRTVFAPPDRYAWTVYTTGEPTHYVFDGRVVRAFVGSALVSEDASTGAALRSHARFMGALQLDGLRAPGVRLRELSAAERPRDTATALEATFADTGDRYVIGLDPQRLVCSVEGPIELPPFGRGTLRVVQSDHRRIGAYRIPHRATWTLDGAPLADEHTRRACALSRALPASSFATPATLPRCP
jgi:hypothetical protein